MKALGIGVGSARVTRHPNARIAFTYTHMFVPIALAAALLCGVVIEASNTLLSSSPAWIGWPLNLAPSSLVGFGGYALIARRHRAIATRSVRGHLVRASVLYMLAIGLGILLMRGQRYADFWMVAQLMLWPWIVALAGIVADVVIHAGPAWRDHSATPVGVRGDSRPAA